MPRSRRVFCLLGNLQLLLGMLHDSQQRSQTGDIIIRVDTRLIQGKVIGALLVDEGNQKSFLTWSPKLPFVNIA